MLSDQSRTHFNASVDTRVKADTHVNSPFVLCPLTPDLQTVSEKSVYTL